MSRSDASRPTPQKVEPVGVLEALAGQVRARSRQALLEVGQRLPLALERALLDVQGEHAARPAVLEGAMRVGQAGGGRLELGQQDEVMPPGQLSNNLLDDCVLRPGLRERSHVEQV